ncbi:hypothetical protein RSOL_455490 [Rhizoctonia solani AG-3 Rhs1AP]|uniref:Uncharacterized protein n=1 Tax=Rhizoctonia solani AG-3 Rhs1AP TaxID=1086054 RepID=X8JGF2_9AGAM|nr:hypothetical protein RSOL_455490 [Rhizoctonia solani AG-3 Rhs1AP]
MEQGSPSITVDLGNLAATIALASEALAAAAEALAEAATAISDASDTFDMSSTPEIKRDIRYPVVSPETPVDKGESRTDNKCGDLQSQIDQYGLANDQGESRFEYGIPATSSPPRSWISILSDSSSEVELVPVDEPLEKPFSAHELRRETNDDSPKTDDTPESGLNNKLQAWLLSIAHLFISEPEIVTNAPVADIALASLQSLVNSLKSYPVIPPGRNYMHLDHESDAFAFIAYMTLQFHRIICLVPEQLMDICLKSLQYLVDVNVYRVNSFSQFRSQSVAFGAVSKPNMCNLMLVPPLFLNFVSSSFISPDCVLHWGQPSSAYRWVNQVLAFIKPTVRVCVMIVEEQSFDGVPYGVAPYSNAVLATCHKPNSPFQLLRQTSTSLLPRVDHPPLRESQDPVSQSNSHPSGSSSTSVLSTAHDWVTNANTFWVGKPLADGLPMMNGA